MTAEGSWWFERALRLQSGVSQLSFEALEWLTMTIFAILDSSDVLSRVILPNPVAGITKQNLYKVSEAHPRSAAHLNLNSHLISPVLGTEI